MAKPVDVKEVVDRLSKQWVDQGKIIEAGWVAMRAIAIRQDAPQWQVDQARTAFFCGAQHLWGSIFSFLEEGQEETDNDLKRISLVAKELDEFRAQMEQKYRPPFND